MLWETMKEDQALQSCTVAAYSGGGFCEPMCEDVNGLFREWAGGIKEQNPGQFMASTLLDAGVEMAKTELLRQAQSCKDPCMAVPLLPNHWLLFVRQDVLEQVGRDDVVRCAHENALRVARNQNKPFCSDTLMAYEQRRQQDELN